MKKIEHILLPLIFLLLTSVSASAGKALHDWAFNIDGTTHESSLGDTLPVVGSLDTEGLGTLSWSTGEAGIHTFIAFFDYEIDEATNTFFNEYHPADGGPEPGQSWEIDEPGFNANDRGDIYENVLAGTLDNSNGVPEGSEDDVSWALGWDFTLGQDQIATITLTLSKTVPPEGFYLAQTDPESGETIYYSGLLHIQNLNTHPTADAGGPYTGNEMEAITFDGSASSDPEGDVLTYTWNFGDGSPTVSGVGLKHSYEDNGTFSVTLTVDDGNGGSDTDTVTVTVANVAPTVDAGLDQTVIEGNALPFSGSFFDPGSADTHTIQWDFGDGNTASDTLTPIHTYVSPGVYTATLTVTDDDGGVGSDTLIVTVEAANRPPVADAGGPYTTLEGAVLMLDGSGTSDPDGDALTYSWDLDNDGEYIDSTGVTTPHSWVDDGIYTIGLRVFDSLLEDTATTTVTVLNVAPTVDAGADQTINEGETVTLVGSFDDPGSADTHTFLWDFGDGTTPSDILTSTHVYGDNGQHLVTLTVTDDDVGIGTDTLTIIVNNVAPTVDAGPDLNIDEGTTFVSSGSFVDPGTDTYTATVDYGDGSGPQPLTLNPDGTYGLNCLYSDSGVYTLTVTVADDDGGVGTDTAVITVTDLGPTAAFTWTPESQIEGEPVSFTDGSTSAPDIITAWSWDFAGLGTSTNQNPSFTFNDNGTYTIILMVSDKDGSSDSISHNVTITDKAPTANLTGDASLDEGATGNYDANGSTSSPDAIVSYEWDWKYDGTFDPSGDIGATQSHAWTDNGTYTVAVRVSDDDGSTDIASMEVTVNNVAPTVDAGADQTVSEGETITFGGSFNDPGSVDTHTTEWDFGDGVTAPGTLTPTHVYDDSGVYTVTLTVTDDDGGVGTDTLTVTVSNVAPAVDSGPDATIDEGGAFASSGSFVDPGADTCTATVDYGDGVGVQPLTLNPDGTFALSCSYSDSGTYTVTVKVTDDDGDVGTDTVAVTVNDLGPTAAFTWAPDPQEEGSSVTFTDSSTSAPDIITAWSWNFAGLGISADENPGFAFSDNGTYTVTLTVTDDDGSIDTVSHDVTITDKAPSAAFTWAPELQTEGSPVTFTDTTTSSPDTIMAWSWDFGGIGTSTESDPSFVFPADGIYPVTLTVTDEDGSKDSVSHDVTVTDNAPTANLTGDTTLNEGTAGSYDASGSTSSPDAIVSYEWDWDYDGTFDPSEAIGATQSHAWTDNGTYTVAVRVSDDDGSTDIASMEVTVNNVAPVAEAGPDQEVLEEDTVQFNGSFTDSGSGDTHTIEWNFGDGNIASGTLTPSHVYTIPGTYTVTLTVTDDDGGVGSDTLTMTVEVRNHPPVADAGGPYTVDEGNLLTLDASGSSDPDPDDVLNCAWDLDNDGEYDDATGVTVTHTWETNGTYTVGLKVTDSYPADDTATATVTVNDLAPEALFNWSPEPQAEGAPVTFTDTSTSFPDTIVGWSWNFGGQGTSIEQSPSFTFQDDGNYTVTLTVTDDDGSTDSASHSVTVTNVAPSVDAGLDKSAKEGNTVSFNGLFTDPGAADTHTIKWNFGDGQTSTGTSTPSHVYADNGMYTVTLTVTDDDNASTTDALIVTVNNVAPTLDAGIDQTVNEASLVSLAPATFNDLGTLDTHTATIDWGDGTAVEIGTVTETPFGPPGSTDGANGSIAGSHVYADDGVYTVSMTVTDDEGDSDTKPFQVTVNNLAPAVNAIPDNVTVQYSDPIQIITITALDVVTDTMNASESWSTDGVNFTVGLPDAMTIDGELEFAGDSDQVGTGTWTLAGIADLAPGTYFIRFTVSDEDNGTTAVDTTIVVNQEDAVATYSGALFVSTSSVRTGEAVVQLRATIQDITAAFPAGPDLDWGNITYAKVSFLDFATGLPLTGTDGQVAEGLDITLVDSSDLTVGVAAFPWNIDLGNKDSETHEIIIRVDSVVVGGELLPSFYKYVTTNDITLITVAKPTNNAVMGGGYIINADSSGLYAGETGLKTNFGFNVKTNKKRTNIQGHVNIIVRRDGHLYQIKSNATDSLLLNPNDSRKAEFTAKANLNDVTDPSNPISLGGNLWLIGTVTDNGEPGDMDLVGYTLWRGAELLFSSNWSGTVTMEQLLDGGNLQVHGEK